MRVARCCWTTKVSGPTVASGLGDASGGGSGVLAKSRFASYSSRLRGASVAGGASGLLVRLFAGMAAGSRCSHPIGGAG